MSTLALYLQRKNAYKRIFKEPEIEIPTTPEQCTPLFRSIEGELSPENLCCDGERSPADTQDEFHFLNAVWFELEVIFGRPVEQNI